MELYDVALSFAGEDRPYVNQVAEFLRRRGVRVFYDNFFDAELWGKNLIDTLDSIYREQSRYVIIFVSQAYAEKEWTNHERRSALARALKSGSEYVLPVRFDDTTLPGLLPTVAYKDARRLSPSSLGSMIIEKVRQSGVQTSTTPSLSDGILAWRITQARWALSLDGKGAALHGGRWNDRGLPVVYCAQSYCAAFMEVLAFLDYPFEMLPEMTATQIRIPPDVSIDTVYEHSLPADWRDRREEGSPTEISGSNWLRSGATCILSVPSAIVPYERLLLLNPAHSDFCKIAVGATEKVNFDPHFFRR